jgi:hypothetical protein
VNDGKLSAEFPSRRQLFFAVNLADCRITLLKIILTYCGRRFANCDLNTEARALGVR